MAGRQSNIAVPAALASRPKRGGPAAAGANELIESCDQAVARGRHARQKLSESLRAGCDAIVGAFEAYEAGRVDEAAHRLKEIGLHSPFLEWKLLLRGLIAYSAGDDGRARDNWSRLCGNRLPGRLAAPLLAALDPHFRAAQPASRQQKLQAVADEFRGGSIPLWRRAMAELWRPERFIAAIEQIAELLPPLRREMPDLEQMLVRTCYAAAAGGHPDGARLLKAHFAPLADDPTWSRLQALAAERRCEFAEANRHWQAYQRVVANAPEWTADRARAQAMIWHRCGINAIQCRQTLPPRPRPKPDAEDCFRRAMALDPNFADPYEALFEIYWDCERLNEAAELGRALAQLKPGDAQLHIDLAEIARTRGEIDDAIACLTRARELDPFNRELIERTGECLIQRARERAIAEDFLGAQNDLAAAERLAPATSPVVRDCLRAAIAYKQGDLERGEEFARSARQAAPAAAALTMSAEAARLKLPNSLRKLWKRELDAVINGSANTECAVGLVEAAIEQLSCRTSYHGAKSDENRVRKYVERVNWQLANPALAVRLCEALLNLEWTPLLRRTALLAGHSFPFDPAFPYYQALSFLQQDEFRNYWPARTQIERARKLAESLPPDEETKRRWLNDIATLEKELAAVSPFGPAGMNKIFEAFL
jgi:tetratricopeptide (TPR) repeat protein